MLDRDGMKIFSKMGVLLKCVSAEFPVESLRLSIVYPFVYVSNGIMGFGGGVSAYRIEQ